MDKNIEIKRQNQKKIEEILTKALLVRRKARNEKRFTLPTLYELLKTKKKDFNTKEIYWIALVGESGEFEYTKFEVKKDSPSKKVKKNLPSKSDIDKGIAFEFKFDTQDLQFRKWHRELEEISTKDDIDRFEATLKKMSAGNKELTESHWFSDLYYKEVSTNEDDKKEKLAFFTVYISSSHLNCTSDGRFLKYNRTIFRAHAKWKEAVQDQFTKEAAIREKLPYTRERHGQWNKALETIKRALSRSLDGWSLKVSKLFDDVPPNKYVKNGDLVSGYIVLKKEKKWKERKEEKEEKEEKSYYIVTIKNEDLMETCSSRLKFLSERYASLIHLTKHNKDPKLTPTFNGLIEVFTLKDSRKDIWKRDLNLTEYNPDKKYDPISLLIEMDGDRFYEPILVHNEKAYSSFVEEMIGSSSDKNKEKRKKKEDSND